MKIYLHEVKHRRQRAEHASPRSSSVAFVSTAQCCDHAANGFHRQHGTYVFDSWKSSGTTCKEGCHGTSLHRRAICGHLKGPRGGVPLLSPGLVCNERRRCGRSFYYSKFVATLLKGHSRRRGPRIGGASDDVSATLCAHRDCPFLRPVERSM